MGAIKKNSMTDKEKILNEIKRRLQDNTLSYKKDKRPQFNKIGRIMEDEDLLTFIDSLQEEPVSEDLEEAIEDAMPDANWYIEENNDTTGEDAYNSIQMGNMFKAGAKWQKEQMMAKAIDGDIAFDYYGDDDKTYGLIAHNSFCLEDFGLKDRDKVKVLVIKED